MKYVTTFTLRHGCFCIGLYRHKGILHFACIFISSDPWDRRKKKGKKHKSSKKGQSTQDKLNSLLARKTSHKGKRNGNGNHGTTERAAPPPPRDAIERACSMKEELLQRIEELGDKLPPNTLDQLIDELGGPENVAEASVTSGVLILIVGVFFAIHDVSCLCHGRSK